MLHLMQLIECIVNEYEYDTQHSFLTDTQNTNNHQIQFNKTEWYNTIKKEA